MKPDYLRGHGVDACTGGLRQHGRARLCCADVHRVAASVEDFIARGARRAHRLSRQGL